MQQSVGMVVKDISENCLGRAHSLSLVLDEIGISWTVLSTRGVDVWEPLRGSSFSKHCFVVDADALVQELSNFSAVIACKPLPETLGICLRSGLGLEGRLYVDVDDPDIENLLSRKNLRWLLSAMIRVPNYLPTLVSCARAAKTLPTIVSNPRLKSKYGGLVIPHVRQSKNSSPLDSEPTPFPTVLFLGTVRTHKGLETIRRAVHQVNEGGRRVDLVVTDSPPGRYPHWEKWIGPQRFSSRENLLARASLAIITVWEEPHRSMQLPAKVLDALLAGVPIIRNDTKVLKWACEGSGYVVPTRSARTLASAIDSVLNFPEQGLPDPTALAEVVRRSDPATYAGCLSTLLNSRRHYSTGGGPVLMGLRWEKSRKSSLVERLAGRLVQHLSRG